MKNWCRNYSTYETISTNNYNVRTVAEDRTYAYEDNTPGSALKKK